MKKSIKTKFMLLTVASFATLAIIISIVGYRTVYNTMSKQVEQEMKSTIAMVEKLYDTKYKGEYGIQLIQDGSYIVYKGKSDITQDYDILDGIKESYGYDVTLFCKNVRVQTTMMNADEERYISTKAASQVDIDVIDQGKSKFYQAVTIEKQPYFAYYEPIILEDGTVYGMFGISRPEREVRQDAWKAVFPLAMICFGLAVILGLLSLRYSRKIVKRVEELQKFMNTVAKGNFNTEISGSLLMQEDELGALAQDAKKMQRAIQLLVEFDALTQLHNRRYGDKRLKQIIQKAKRSGAEFCVGITDIDFFKKVNDTYGHDAGDEVLRMVSAKLKKHMAGKGFVARWGGEEFLIVFEMSLLEDAVVSLEAMFEEIRNTIVVCNDQEISVTMSMGIIQGNPMLSDDELLKQADDLLYYAKTHGRNQVQSDAKVLQESE